MGKTIIVPDISYLQDNLGKVNFLRWLDNNVLTIRATTNLTISFPKDLFYNDWSTTCWKLYRANSILTVQHGEDISFKANLIPNADNGIGTFSITGTFTIEGNICSLINYEPIREYCFKYLFKDCTGLTLSNNLILAPDIINNCYEGMFKGCTSLHNTPVLSSPILADDCYKEMFYGCTSLSRINIFSEMQLGEQYSKNWVYGVALSGEVNQSVNITYTESGVDGLPSGWTVNKSYKLNYFTIESLENNNTIYIQNINCRVTPEISYSLDNGLTWNTIISDSGTKTIATINEGEYIIFKGENSSLSQAYSNYNRFNSSKTFKVYGNVMSLLKGDLFGIDFEFESDSNNNFTGLFYSVSTLVDASDLVLPATLCNESCYNCMFRNCTNLVTGPKELPALYAAHDCYSSMFEGCINLEEAPVIKLINTADTCCCRMFCMSRTVLLYSPQLTKGPVLLPSTDASFCYKEMFKGNGNLTEVTCLLNEPSASLTDWLTNCSATGTLKKKQGVTWTAYLPSGWTQEDYIES